MARVFEIEILDSKVLLWIIKRAGENLDLFVVSECVDLKRDTDVLEITCFMLVSVGINTNIPR